MATVGGQLVFAVAPQPCERMECWTRGGQKQGDDVGGPLERLRVVTRAIVEHDEIPRMRNGSVQAVSPELEGGAVEGGEFEKAARPRGGATAPER